jgi:hypothetical protein
MKPIGVVAVGLAVLASFSACGSDSDGTSASKSGMSMCWESDEGCECGPDRPATAVTFSGTCSATDLAEHAYCCKRDDTCVCDPVQCSVGTDGVCLCGLSPRPGDIVVESCSDRAQTCCTQDTGYCYCEDGCEKRFANRVVATCDRATNTVDCGDYWARVDRCE